MRSLFLLLSFLFLSENVLAQHFKASTLLKRSIAYHDPKGNWSSFDGEFLLTMKTRSKKDRTREFHINLPMEYFYLKIIKDTITTEYTVNNTECTIARNGDTDLPKNFLIANNLTCEKATMYKDYYTYLYGLPMKLQDSTAIFSDDVVIKRFKRKRYLVLKATYDENPESDVWFFYFNTRTFALEAYQFFKGDPKGSGKDTGEYVMLTGEVIINDIKIPKNRASYRNRDDRHLGTDVLE